jgi:putative chitinase
MQKPDPIGQLGLRELATIAGRTIDTANAKSALAGLETYGYAKLRLDMPHRLAQYLAQIMHESMSFRYDKEIWGPTPAQKRYDARTDLGNTPELDGDGKLYSGRTAGQITGKANYARFTKWARAVDPMSPDFVRAPELINTDPWEGLGFIWFWEENKINTLADGGGVGAVTKRVNGGYNGLEDRQRLYVRAALVLLGYDPEDVVRFQMAAGIVTDGNPGPKTRAALHRALLLARAISWDKPAITPPNALRKPTEYGILTAIGALIGWAAQTFFGG